MADKNPPIPRRVSRRRAQNVVQFSVAHRERFHSNVLAHLEEVARVGSFRWQPASNRVALSAELYRILARTTAHFDGTLERFLWCFHPDDREVLQNSLRRSLRHEQPFRNRLRIVRPNKEVRVLDLAGDVVLGEHGVVQELYCICRDSTEEEQVEQRLLHSEARYRLLVERMKDYAFLMLDREGRITTWNEGAERIKGYSAEEIIGQHFSLFYTPEDIKLGRPEYLLTTAMNHGRAEDEGWRVRKDGSLFWADVIITGLWDDKGNLRGFGKLTRDLTEQRLTQQTLNESQERLRAIFEHSPSMIFMKDTHGRYIDCNPPFEALCGKPRDEIIGKTDLELFHIQQATDFISNDRLVLETGIPVRFEETALHKDGSHISIVSKFPLRDPSGTTFAIGGIVTDITKRKQAEQSLHQLSRRLLQLQDEGQQHIARELEAGIAEKLEELRTRLVSLQEAGVVVDKKMSGVLDQSLSLASDAAQEVQTLAHLLYPRALDNAGLLEAIRVHVQNFSSDLGITVTLDVPDQFERLPQESERALFRVAQEALTNVRRHSGSATATVRVAKERDTVTLAVSDNGKGIPPGILDPESGTAAIPGVGIRGMMERIKQLGGHLDINTGSWGTIVSATLPALIAPRT